MTALREIKKMQEAHEAFMAKYENSAEHGDSLRYHMHRGMATSFQASAAIVHRARVRYTYWTIFLVLVGFTAAIRFFLY